MCAFSRVPGYDLIEWLMDRFNLDETSNGECTVVGATPSRRRTPVEPSYFEKQLCHQVLMSMYRLELSMPVYAMCILLYGSIRPNTAKLIVQVK